LSESLQLFGQDHALSIDSINIAGCRRDLVGPPPRPPSIGLVGRVMGTFAGFSSSIASSGNGATTKGSPLHDSAARDPYAVPIPQKSTGRCSSRCSNPFRLVGIPWNRSKWAGLQPVDHIAHLCRPRFRTEQTFDSALRCASQKILQGDYEIHYFPVKHLKLLDYFDW